MARRYASLEDRIIANSVLLDEFYWNGSYCWIWIGKTVNSAHSSKKYGVINLRIKGKHVSVRVARLVLQVFKGRRMTRKDVAKHLCPHTSLCCNPEHLQGGSQRSNVLQAMKEGTHHRVWEQRRAA